MLHKNRVWSAVDVPTAEELAKLLAGRMWTLCTGWRLSLGGRKLLFLNDSISEDGAAEWGVWDEDAKVQVETITFGWMKDPAEALKYIMFAVETPAGKSAWQSKCDPPKISHDGPCRYCR